MLSVDIFTRPHWTHHSRRWLPFRSRRFCWHMEGLLAPRYRTLQSGCFILVRTCSTKSAPRLSSKSSEWTTKVKIVMKKWIRCENPLSIASAHALWQRLDKEILVWHRLDHENVLPLLGITHDFGRGNPVGMVCPWLENGNLNGYLERCQAVLSLRGRFRIVRPNTFILIVASWLVGLYASFAKWPLAYRIVSKIQHTMAQNLMEGITVHSNDVVHGDLTGVRPFGLIYSHANWLSFQVKYSHW